MYKTLYIRTYRNEYNIDVCISIYTYIYKLCICISLTIFLSFSAFLHCNYTSLNGIARHGERTNNYCCCCSTNLPTHIPAYNMHIAHVYNIMIVLYYYYVPCLYIHQPLHDSNCAIRFPAVDN